MKWQKYRTIMSQLQQLNTILSQFATTVGVDYKTLKTLIDGLTSQVTALEAKPDFDEAAVNLLIDAKVTEVKNLLLGGDVSDSLDTIKELGEALASLQNDDTIKGAILNKFTELRNDLSAIDTRVTALENGLNNLSSLDLVATYTQAKTR